MPVANLKRTRKDYEQRPKVKLKRWIKNHNKDYTEKRQKYAQDPKVKERRSVQNARRRQLSTNLIAMLRSGKLSFDGEKLDYSLGRCVIPAESKVVTLAKLDGTLVTKHYDEQWEIDGEDFDRKRELDPEFLELLRKYQDGLIEVQSEPVKINRQVILAKQEDDGSNTRHSAEETC